MVTRMPAVIAAAILTLALALPACSSTSSAAPSKAASSSSPSAATGTETLYGEDTGQAAAANLNSSGSKPLTFTTFTYKGPVSLTVKPFTLPGGNGPTGTGTLPGGLRVHHASTLPGAGKNTPPPATWMQRDGKCYFSATFDKGTYTVVPGSTGKFKGATGHGTYLITASGWAPLAKGKTACSFSNTGPVSAQGADITFTAAGPLTVPPAVRA